jgi:ferrous iron transport protein B
VGKSVVFNSLTGRYAEVSNYPGTTVEVSRGKWRGNIVVDTPGVYGLTGANDEERLAQAIIDKAQIIINVVDVTRLRRDLFLTLHLLNLGRPMLVVANMMDEARRAGRVPNLSRLEAALGVPVLPAAAVRGEGMAELAAALGKLCTQGTTLKKGGTEVAKDLRAEANRIYAAVSEPEVLAELSPVDRWLTRPLTGLVTGAAVMAAIWWVLGGLVADKLVAFTEGVVMKRWLIPPLVRGLQGLMPGEGLLKQVLAGEFGVLTMALAYGLGLLLPLVFSYYLLLAVLEDSGYLPRLAVLLDNTFRPVGLNGKAVIPLILGFGCVTMAVISTRVLSSRRERIILTFLLGIAVPCSAQTGIAAMMLVPMGLGWVALYAGVLLAVFLTAGILLNKILPGQTPGLFLELPRLRLPRPGNILRKSWAKSRAFLKDALPLFALGAILVTLLDYFHILSWLEQTMAPLTSGCLKLPPQVMGSFIMGLIRRDFGVAGLHALGLARPQLFVALMTMTLFVPCIATVLVTIKEQGVLMAISIWLVSIITALAVGGILAAVI